MHGCEILDLVPTAGTRGNNYRVGSKAFPNFLDERCRHLEREFVFLLKHPKDTSHSAATGIEQDCLSTGKSLYQANHETGMQKRLRVAMRMDRDLRGLVFEF